MRTPLPRNRGFTLMEVALALFIIAIAVVSLLSMVGVALDSDRAAGRDTVLAEMSSQVLNRLRAAPFDALWLADPSATPNPPVPGYAPPADTAYYFSDDGTLLANTTGGVPPGTIFRCVVKKEPDESSRAVAGTGSYNRMMLHLQFCWPVSSTTAADARPNLTVLHASIARY